MTIQPATRKAIRFAVLWTLTLTVNAWSFYRMGKTHAVRVALDQRDRTYNSNYVNMPRDTLLVNLGRRLAIWELVNKLLDENK